MTTNDAELESVSAEIQKCNDECSDNLAKLDEACYEEVNSVLQERSDYLVKEGIAGQFWAAAIMAHRDIREELMGSYDEEILKSLTNIMVKFVRKEVPTTEEEKAETGKATKTEAYRKIEFHFSSNEYFKNDVLWIEINETQGIMTEDIVKFGGVQWCDGKGPATAKEIAVAQAAVDKKIAAGGRKRDREDEDEADPLAIVKEKTSFFEIFEPLPEHPVNENNTDAELDAEDDWEQAFNEKDEIIKAIMQEIWTDPVSLIRKRSQE